MIRLAYPGHNEDILECLSLRSCLVLKLVVHVDEHALSVVHVSAHASQAQDTMLSQHQGREDCSRFQTSWTLQTCEYVQVCKIVPGAVSSWQQQSGWKLQWREEAKPILRMPWQPCPLTAADPSGCCRPHTLPLALLRLEQA